MVASLDLETYPNEHDHWDFPDQALIEAIKDTIILQAMIESLLDSVQRAYEDLQLKVGAQEEPSLFEKFRLRHVEELIASIFDIKTDVEELLEIYKHPPVKSFIRTNYDQLRAIHRLAQLLPALHPFLSLLPNQMYSAPPPIYNAPQSPCLSETPTADDVNNEVQEINPQHGEYQDKSQIESLAGRWRPEGTGMEARVGATACFDREPRSLSSLPEKVPERIFRWAAPMGA